MLLQRNNFTIPVRLIFRPFGGRQWEVRTAKLLEWRVEKVWMLTSYVSNLHVKATVANEPTAVSFSLSGIGINSVLGLKSEPRKNSLDLIGKSFPLFVCRPSSRNPGRRKNAWAMRDEFFDTANTDESPGFAGLLQFLDRWGAFYEPSRPISAPHLQHLIPAMQRDDPFFGCSFTFPHLLIQKREEYRQAILPKNAAKWLVKSDPLYPKKINNPPYYLLEQTDCMAAIEATITLDHLAGRRFGFCERCGKHFEQETKRKKTYCSGRCINAANVKKWRDNRPNPLEVETSRGAEGEKPNGGAQCQEVR